MNRTLTLMLLILTLILFIPKLTYSSSCDFECAEECNRISGSCLNANPYDPYENPWGHGDHISTCRNLYDRCMAQAFPQQA